MIRVAAVAASLAGAGCGPSPDVIFRVTSTALGVTADIRACRSGEVAGCSGTFAQVLGENDRAGAGAIFDLPEGVTTVPIEVQQNDGGGATRKCKRTVVTVTSPPVELQITAGGAAPEIVCPAVACTAAEDCPVGF